MCLFHTKFHSDVTLNRIGSTPIAYTHKTTILQLLTYSPFILFSNILMSMHTYRQWTICCDYIHLKTINQYCSEHAAVKQNSRRAGKLLMKTVIIYFFVLRNNVTRWNMKSHAAYFFRSAVSPLSKLFCMLKTHYYFSVLGICSNIQLVHISKQIRYNKSGVTVNAKHLENLQLLLPTKFRIYGRPTLLENFFDYWKKG